MPEQTTQPLTRDDAFKVAMQTLDNESAGQMEPASIPLWLILATAQIYERGFDAGVASQQIPEWKERASTVGKVPASIGPEIQRLLERQVPPIHLNNLNIAAMITLLASTIDAQGRILESRA